MTNQTELMNAWGTIGDEGATTVVETKEKEGLDYLATPEGDTRVRVMDIAPFAYKEWWSVQGNGGEGNGTSIPYKGADDLLEKDNKAHMSKVFAEADKRGYAKGSKERKDFLRDNGYKACPWGNSGKPKEKAIIHVIDRADGKLKLMDKTAGFFKALRDYALNPEYGDLRQYDITIKRTGTGWQDTEYTVTPARSNTPITDAEKAMYEANKADLAELKGGANVSPEQAYAVAKGALWSDVMNSEGQATQQVPKKNYTGEDCGSCGEPQWNSPSGVTCDNGHGGAEPKRVEPVNVETGQAHTIEIPARSFTSEDGNVAVEIPRQVTEVEPVNVETGQALTEDELAGIDFNA